MKKIMWWIWRHRKLSWVASILIQLSLLGWLYKYYEVPPDDILMLLIKLLEDLNLLISNISTKYPGIYLAVTALLAIVITIILQWMIEYHLLPRNKSDLLKSIYRRCDELVLLSYRRLEQNMHSQHKWLDSLRRGSNFSAEKCRKLGREVLEVTSAKSIFATCLQKPQDVYDHLQDFSQDFIIEINKRKKTLTRLLVCEQPQMFDLKQQQDTEVRKKIKWFINLHFKPLESHGLKNSLLEKIWPVNLHYKPLILNYIEKEKFIKIASTCGIDMDKLDFMLFDKKFVFSLKNDPLKFNTMLYGKDYTLILTDSKTDVDEYENFRKKLESASRDLCVYIKEKGWQDQYL